VVAGCGVPTHTDVRVEGSPPEAGSPEFVPPDPPPGPDDATDEAELVTYFLQAAARDPDNAVEELREFIRSDERDDWQPDSQVYVVRSGDDARIDTPSDPYRVDLTVRRVGQLTVDPHSRTTGRSRLESRSRSGCSEDWVMAVCSGIE
jgi:hypothetical protein